MKATSIARTGAKVAVAGAAALGGYVFVIRPWHVRWGATDDEVVRTMPGDDVVPQPLHVSTRAVTVRARPEDIWPWLVQMGYQQGGLHSSAWLDYFFGFLGRPGAERVSPEHQHLEAGDVIPLGRGTSLPVHAIEPNRSLVLAPYGADYDITWAFALYPLDEQHTRLVSRVCANIYVTPTSLPTILAIDSAAFILVRSTLLGIKRRAETLA